MKRSFAGAGTARRLIRTVARESAGLSAAVDSSGMVGPAHPTP